MKSKDFNQPVALKAAQALDKVLRARRHKKVHLGEEIWVQGKLSDALGLPKIIRQLSSKVAARREQGLLAFQELWPTLSEQSRQRVQEAIGWYEAEQLDWDDKRSNRRINLDDFE
jgi:hypothetical protein